MTNLKIIEENLEQEDENLKEKFFESFSFKQFVSKFTFLISTIPPVIIILIVFLLQWKIIYAVILILFYQLTFYWFIETKFPQVIQFAQKAKSLILPYFQKSP